MLLKFKHVHSREAINSHLMRKFDDVLVQYCKEVPHEHLLSVTIVLKFKDPKEPWQVFTQTDGPFFCRWNMQMKPLRL